MPHLEALTDLTYGPHLRQKLDVFVPVNVSGGATVLCLHGGWWTAGSHHDLRGFALHLAELGFSAATMGHRHLEKDVKSGAELVEDVKTCAQRAVDEAGLLGASDKGVILLGSGSGSLPVLAAAWQLANDRTARLRVRGMIACGVTPSALPWEGCPLALTKTLHAYAGSAPAAFNPSELRADGFPPLLLLHGDADSEVPLKTAHKFQQRIAATGETCVLAPIPGAGHQFIDNPFDRPARAALDSILPFIKDHAADPEIFQARA